MYFIVSPVPGLLATKSYVVLTQGCFRSECLGQSLMLALHAVTPTPHKAVTLEEYKKIPQRAFQGLVPASLQTPPFLSVLCLLLLLWNIPLLQRKWMW